MNRSKLAAGIILIFILGILTGALAVELYHKHEFRGGPPRPPSPAERTDFIMKRLIDDLDLTPDQISEIRPIVEATENAVSELMDRIDPEMKSIHDRNFAAIREKLNPDQQLELDKIRERVKKFRRKPPKP